MAAAAAYKAVAGNLRSGFWAQNNGLLYTPGNLLDTGGRPPGIFAVNTLQEAQRYAWQQDPVARIRGGIRCVELSFDDPADVVARAGRHRPIVLLRRCQVVAEHPVGPPPNRPGRRKTPNQADGLFDRLLQHLPEPRPGIHGIEHWRQVAANARTLALETAGVDEAVAQAFAALHDSCRHRDGPDPQHGPRAAALASQLQRTVARLPISTERLALLCHALERHDQGETSRDPTVGVCWDADRLDLTRLRIRPQPRLLSTDAGKKAAQQTLS